MARRNRAIPHVKQMRDLSIFRNGQVSVKEWVEREGIAKNDLSKMTNEMIDRMLGLIADSTDADVTFVPSDPGAHDSFASNPEDVDLAWTLGHVIVHTTASAEEAAFLAAEVARGVPWRGGRARYEVPWQSVTTIQECRERLEESRQMRLASLELWPHVPHLENTYEPRPGVTHNCISRFVSGLVHDDSHLGQIEKIAAQAREARNNKE
jgi:hypothetical protein